jgi:hypothetical protein
MATEKDREPTSDEPKPLTYEPPKLVRLGSLRFVLGKTGLNPDRPPVFGNKT